MREIKISSINFEPVKEALSRYILNDIKGNPDDFSLMNSLCQFYTKMASADVDGDVVIEVAENSIAAVSRCIKNNISEDVKNNPGVTLEWIAEMISIYNDGCNLEAAGGNSYIPDAGRNGAKLNDTSGGTDDTGAVQRVKYVPDETLDIETSGDEEVMDPEWEINDEDQDIY